MDIQSIKSLQFKNSKVSETWDSIVDRFFEAGQSHVFKWAPQLSPEEGATLMFSLHEIGLDFLKDDRVLQLIHGSTGNSSKDIQPFPKDLVCGLGENLKKRAEWEETGFNLLAQGKVGILLLAGGQGTRLGTTRPKGMYNVGLLSGKSLFQLQAERLLKTTLIVNNFFQRKDISIPWYIMTSESTQEETEKFFRDHNYWSLNPKDILFFEQDILPCITPQGKIIMESKTHVAKAPNGNGGLYSALVQKGVLDDMKRRGIEIVLQYCVDNILVKMADPIFLGFLAETKPQCAAKVCAKTNPTEAVGVLGLVNQKPDVIEYSELDKNLSVARDEQGNLLFNEAHLCMNMFSVPFLDEMGTKLCQNLPFHIAKKKIPCANEKGETVMPDDINGWKLELFIFDSFPFAQKMVAYEVDRMREFAPLKNATGNDSPETCKVALSELHKRLITEAGGFISDLNTQDLVEIDPLIGEDLAPLVKDIKINRSIELHRSINDRDQLRKSLGFNSSSEDEK